jgi:hypothetical protein
MINMNDIILEPDGGNVYRPHHTMIDGKLWRCAHGNTGLSDRLKWIGCKECSKDDPVAFALFHEE